jgi:predicted pPIWI-associating nuclease
MTTPQLVSADLKRINDSELLQSILKAVDEYDLSSSPDWSDLDQLSNHTEFESLEANPDGIFEGPPGSFQAVGKVYVTLNYGDKHDTSSISDSYPVQLAGTFNRQTRAVSIDHVAIDTSSFYS